MSRAVLSSKINVSETQKRGVHPGHVTSPAMDKHTINTLRARADLRAEIDVVLTELGVERAEQVLNPEPSVSEHWAILKQRII